MSYHIVGSYDHELASLTSAIITMGLLVEELLDIAAKSLKDNDQNYFELAQQVDNKINNHNQIIEQQAINILALRQPVAIDLRQAVSALRITVIMERMGDLAKGITKRAIKINIKTELNIEVKITQLIQAVKVMLNNTLRAFAKSDQLLAISLLKDDLIVDKLYSILIHDLEQIMINHTEAIYSLMQLSFALKNIERIGDHLTKIGKIIYYIATGNRFNENNSDHLINNE